MQFLMWLHTYDWSLNLEKVEVDHDFLKSGFKITTCRKHQHTCRSASNEECERWSAARIGRHRNRGCPVSRLSSVEVVNARFTLHLRLSKEQALALWLLCTSMCKYGKAVVASKLNYVFWQQINEQHRRNVTSHRSVIHICHIFFYRLTYT